VLDPGCPDGPHPPEGKLAEPISVATDQYGSIYVVNRNGEEGNFYVDVFDASGRYVTNVLVPWVKDIDVDSEGRLYVVQDFGSTTLHRFDPTVYKPLDSEISYDSPAIDIEGVSAENVMVDPRDDSVYFGYGSYDELGQNFNLGRLAPAVDGVSNEFMEVLIPAGDPPFVGKMALDASRNRIYMLSGESQFGPLDVRAFSLEAPHQELAKIPGPPGGAFTDTNTSIAVDEKSGNVFVGDIFHRRKVYEFAADGEYLGTLKGAPTEGRHLWFDVDNSPLSPNQGFLYIPAGGPNTGHLYAFEPQYPAEPPVVGEVSVHGVTRDEAVIRARINPEGAATQWFIEYVADEAFQREGFAGATVVGTGTLANSREESLVSAVVRGLMPGTAYRVRVRAESQCPPDTCTGEGETQFRTFPLTATGGECTNARMRLGPSAALPDCRAFELVTPSDTAGLLPWAPNSWAGQNFRTPPASPDGNSVAFMAFGSVLPGMVGNGSFNGNSYLTRRTSTGWITRGTSPNGTQATGVAPGGLSSDHDYQALWATHGGSLVINEDHTGMVRYPDGSFRLVGDGSLADTARGLVRYIAPGGTHLIFQNSDSSGAQPVQLEPNGPPTGTRAVYDRTADGILHVVSLLPGDVTPAAGNDAEFEGASQDGRSIAFRLDDGLLYVRVDNAWTLPVAGGTAVFAGLSDEGRYLFYMLGGDLFRFDTQTGDRVRATELGDVDPVNVASEGQGAYFLSPSVAGGVGPNGQGAEPQAGEHNLYYWNGSATQFVATVTKRDAEGGLGERRAGGLGLWLQAVAASVPGILSSRTTPDGTVLLFESRANLTTYDSHGKAQVYRYDGATGSLRCLSCDPTGAAPSGDSTLLAWVGDGAGPGSLIADANGINPFVDIPNLSTDGRRAFFETAERLAVEDVDGLADVYQWEANGKGSCSAPEGCVSLISSGKSGRPDHLFGVSKTGDDVFILTSDLLVAQDTDETPSVYDARVEGGFPAPSSGVAECLGEACQPSTPPPTDPAPNSASYHGSGNVVPKSPRRSCPKGKRAGRKAGRKAANVRCKRQKKARHGKSRKQSSKESRSGRRAHR
jgi:hypothetical protein